MAAVAAENRDLGGADAELLADRLDAFREIEAGHLLLKMLADFDFGTRVEEAVKLPCDQASDVVGGELDAESSAFMGQSMKSTRSRLGRLGAAAK